MIIRNVKSGNIPAKIMEQIKENIINHKLKPGDRLPSERELAERSGVSRTSVREALRSLEMLGIINTVWGDGSYVSEDVEDSLSDSMEMLFSITGHNPNQVFELRRAVEVETISLAAMRATSSDVRDLRDLCEKIETAATPSQSANIDNQFHTRIAKISGNIFFTSLLKSVNGIMVNFILLARNNIIASKNRPIISSQHQEMIRAIKQGDPAMARKIMLQHLELIEKYYIKLIGKG